MMKLRNPFARATEPVESEPETRAARPVDKPHQDLELDRASRQLECCRYVDQAITREPRRARFAIVDDDPFK